MIAMGIQNNGQKRALLWYYGGDELCEILETLNSGDTFDSAVEAFDRYIQPQKNVEFEIYKFRQAKQETVENIDAFHMRLRKLSENCGFTT